jgi:hypothetical protein
MRACLLVLLLTGCVAASEDPVEEPSKEDVLAGKEDGPGWCWLLGADAGCDVCEELGWYGDGDCDQLIVDTGICHQRDPDCPPPGCFESHLLDAIELNQERAPLYASASAGRSQRISSRLITSERALLPPSRWLDRRAASWQAAGVGLLCDELVSLDDAPAFVARVTPPATAYVRPDGLAIAAGLTGALLSAGYDGLHAAIETELAALAPTPAYHCMLRHVLESTLRAVNLAPVHEAESAQLGLASPRAISRDLIVAQIGLIAVATTLDDDAAALQADGIPILCRDVPPIPPGP